MSTIQLPWTEKYRPKSTSQLKGVTPIIQKVLKWLQEWNPKQKQKGLLLIGPAGSGKTTLVYAIANDLQYDVVEVNASDVRNKEKITHLVGLASNNRSILSYTSNLKNKLILIDEVDGISGTDDRGGLSSLKDILKKTMVPIILTANDTESDKVVALEKLITKIEFQRLCEPTIYFVLKDIALKEHQNITPETLQFLAENSAGDLRGAINDLESLPTNKLPTLIPTNRDHDLTLLETIQNIFQSTSLQEARTHGFTFSTSKYQDLLALYQEIIIKYVNDPFIREQLLTAIAHADLILNRIMKRSEYTLLKYFFFDLSGKIGYILRKNNVAFEVPALAFPQKFQYLKKRKMLFEKRIKIASRIKTKLHLSVNTIVHEVFPYLEKICLNNPQKGAEILAWLNFSETDIIDFFGTDNSLKILEIYDDVQTLFSKSLIKTTPLEDIQGGLGEHFNETKPTLSHHLATNDISLTSSTKQKETLDSSLSPKQDTAVHPLISDDEPLIPSKEEKKSKTREAEKPTEQPSKKQKTLDDFW